MAKLTVKDVDLKGKKVLVRVDFNVPLKDGVITNDNRISAALPTIKYIIEQGGRAILFSHLGRVKEEADKEGKSLAPVAADLAAKLGQDVVFPGVTRGAELEEAINNLKEKGFIFLNEKKLICLTKKGFVKAVNVYSRHVQLTKFLMNTINLRYEIAVKDACRIEHLISDECFLGILNFNKKNLDN